MTNQYAEARDKLAEKAEAAIEVGNFALAGLAATVAQVHALAYIGDALTDILDKLDLLTLEVQDARAERAEQAQDLRNTIAELRGA